MKKIITLSLIFIMSIVFANVTFAKQTPTAADQIEQVASHTTKNIGNMIDSGKAKIKSNINTIDTSGNFRMIYNDVKSGINGLASALKIGAEHVYTVLVKQQTVNSVSNMLLIIILYVISVILYKKSKNSYESHLILCGYTKEKNNSYNIDLSDSAKGIVSVILGGLSTLSFLIGTYYLIDTYNSIIMGFINPEYGAMKDIINFVKN